jgi:hypothetical protein
VSYGRLLLGCGAATEYVNMTEKRFWGQDYFFLNGFRIIANPMKNKIRHHIFLDPHTADGILDIP